MGVGKSNTKLTCSGPPPPLLPPFSIAVTAMAVAVVFVVVVVVVVGVDNGDEDGTVGLAPRWADAYLPVSSESPASGSLWSDWDI